MASLHTLTIPPLIRALHNLTSILHLALASPIPLATLLTAGLHLTMHSLPTQIHLLTTHAISIPPTLNPSLPRLTLPPISPTTTDQTFTPFLARLAQTIAYLDSIRPEDINGREDERIKLRIERPFAGNVAYVEFPGAGYTKRCEEGLRDVETGEG